MQSNQEMGTLPIRFRTYAPEDRNFILNSWLKSYRKSLSVKDVDQRVYFHNQADLVDALIQRSHVVVAVSEKDPTDIYGYIIREKVGSTNVIHYIYVKKTYRLLGVGHHLLIAADCDPDKGMAYTHHTHVANKLRYKYNALFNPYVLIFNDYEDKEEVGDAES